jgi:hypothetical protein
MNLELRRGDLVNSLGLVMKICKETIDIYEVLYSKVIYELKWLTIIENELGIA